MIRLRTALVIGAVLGSVAVASPPAGAAVGSVEIVDGTNRASVSLGSIGGFDINNQPYRFKGETTSLNGFSVSRILEKASEGSASGWLKPREICEVKIVASSGFVFRARGGSSFPEGPPIFFPNNEAIVFVAPPAAGEKFARKAEFRSTEPQIVIKQGASCPTEFKVSLSFSPANPGRAQAVTIRANVIDAPTGATLRYQWNFSDGTPVLTTFASRVVHRFAGKAPRSVTVTVRSDDGKEDQDSLSIDMVDRAGDGDRRGGGNRNSGKGGSGQASGADSVPPLTSTASGSGSGTGAGVDSGFGTGAPAVSALSAPPPEPSPRQESSRRQQPDGLETVSGELIGPDTQVLEVPPQEFPSEGAGPSELDDGPGFLGGMAGEAGTLLGVGLLMALGGLIEVRFLSRRS